MTTEPDNAQDAHKGWAFGIVDRGILPEDWSKEVQLQAEVRLLKRKLLHYEAREERDAENDS